MTNAMMVRDWGKYYVALTGVTAVAAAGSVGIRLVDAIAARPTSTRMPAIRRLAFINISHGDVQLQTGNSAAENSYERRRRRQIAGSRPSLITKAIQISK